MPRTAVGRPVQEALYWDEILERDQDDAFARLLEDLERQDRFAEYAPAPTRRERAHLVLEPLRWALALRPRWIALEQVEPVLPIWEATAMALRTKGYSAWTGVVSAEQYGVPQTRRRAILLASLDTPVGAPPPTHQRFIPPRRREEATLGLFDAPEPERIVAPEDAHLLPWVSMAQALGWPPGDVGFPRLADTPSNKSGGVVEINGVAYRDRDLRPTFEPAFALTEKARSWRRWSLRTSNQANAAERDADEPAPTLHFGHRCNEVAWRPHSVVDTGNTRSGTRPEGRERGSDEPAPTITSRGDQLEWRDGRPTHYDSRGQRDGRTRELNRQRAIDEPAPTIAGESRNDSWTHDRPATTVNGDPRISEPGHHDANVSGSQQANAVRVSIEEALVLQSFPPDYPLQGTKTKQFEQVGNAVPPLLAWHALRAVVPAAEREVAA